MKHILNSIISAPGSLILNLKNRHRSKKFKSFGKNAGLGRALNIKGPEAISIGDSTRFNDGVFLTAWPELGLGADMKIGSGCQFGAFNHLSCANKIVIGDGCLTGKWVSIVDNDHGDTSFESLQIPPLKRAIVSKGPIIIGKNVWIGDKATILSNVTIGEGAIVAANAVVTRDVPPFCVVAGSPARVVKDSRKND